jgi:hypothetical protein
MGLPDPDNFLFVRILPYTPKVSGQLKLYHRERICFHQLLAATRRRKKITKPPTLSAAPLSINQATLSARAPFNQPDNFERARPFQSTRQL